MQWSQLKKRIEDGFAPAVRGRVQVWNTRYRRAHDDVGEAWITVDKKRVLCSGYYGYRKRFHEEMGAVLQAEEGTQCAMATRGQRELKAWDQTSRNLHEKGVMEPEYFNAILFAYLNLSIPKILASGIPLIRAMGMLDRRFGKRRLQAFDARKAHSLVKLFHEFRCQAEGIRTRS